MSPKRGTPAPVQRAPVFLGPPAGPAGWLVPASLAVGLLA
jgi:hypothetical protein